MCFLESIFSKFKKILVHIFEFGWLEVTLKWPLKNWENSDFSQTGLTFYTVTFYGFYVETCYYIRWKGEILCFPTHTITFFYVESVKSYDIKCKAIENLSKLVYQSMKGQYFEVIEKLYQQIYNFSRILLLII